MNPAFCILSLLVVTGSSPETSDQPALAGTNDPRPILRLKTRLHLRSRAQEIEPRTQLEIRRSRMALDLRPTERLRTEIDVDVSQAPALKDGFAELRVFPWLSLRVGQFKKPFSRIELTSPARLPIWRRGILNEWLTERWGFAGRDRGVALGGKAGLFGYTAGIFNGSRATAEVDSGKDAAGRLTLRPWPWLRVGASGSFKYRNAVGVRWPRRDIWAAGLDFRLRFSRLDLTTEAVWALDGRQRFGRHAGGLVTIIEVPCPITESLQLAPVAKLDLFDPNLERKQDLAGAFTAGVNIHLGDHLRVMLQGEVRAPQGQSPIRRTRLLVLQLAWDQKLDVIQTLPGAQS